MDSWAYFLVTAAAIAVVATCIVAIRFFRKLYFMVEELNARMIQIRDMIKPPSPTEKPAKPAKPQQAAQPAQRISLEQPQQAYRK